VSRVNARSGCQKRRQTVLIDQLDAKKSHPAPDSGWLFRLQYAVRGRRLRATIFGRYPICSMISLTRVRVSSFTSGLRFTTRDTVLIDTPALSATSRIVTPPRFFIHPSTGANRSLPTLPPHGRERRQRASHKRCHNQVYTVSRVNARSDCQKGGFRVGGRFFRKLTDRPTWIIINILKYVYMFQHDHKENLWMW